MNSNNKILVVIVLFNKNLSDIPSLNKIFIWMGLNARPNGFNVEVCLVYDNSPVAQSAELLNRLSWLNYFHDSQNGGTRAAYAFAAHMAHEKGCSWILLLDHDTLLDDSFLENAFNSIVSNLKNGVKIDVIVPFVFDQKVQVSPIWISGYGRVFPYLNERPPLVNCLLSAISSGVLIKANVMHDALPIPDQFRLDYLDHWLFRRLQASNKKIGFSHSSLVHSLSVLSMAKIDSGRYVEILSAEREFLKGCKNYSSKKYLFWSFLRILKLIMTLQRPSIILAASHSFFGTAKNE